jgi:predicted Fe-Mo cluster-binding NifX family protein
MRFALPIADRKLAPQFSRCPSFSFVDVREGRIVARVDEVTPKQGCCELSDWLAKRGTEIVIAAAIGKRAAALLSRHGIELCAGAPIECPERLVRCYLKHGGLLAPAMLLQDAGGSCEE